VAATAHAAVGELQRAAPRTCRDGTYSKGGAGANTAGTPAAGA